MGIWSLDKAIVYEHSYHSRSVRFLGTLTQVTVSGIHPGNVCKLVPCSVKSLKQMSLGSDLASHKKVKLGILSPVCKTCY